MAKEASYLIRGSKHFLIAPFYEYKFGLKKRGQSVILQNIPYLRNLFATAVYYLVAPGIVPAKSNKPAQSQATGIETKEYEKVPG